MNPTISARNNATNTLTNAELAPALYNPLAMVLELPETRTDHTLYFKAGEIIREAGTSSPQTYVVTNGEVVILRNGIPVDILEPGDLLDDLCWAGATALAHSNCALSIVEEQPAEADLFSSEEFDADGTRQLLRAIMGPLAYQ